MNPGVIFARRDIAKEAPDFGVTCALPRSQFDPGRQTFQFKKFRIGEDFKVASKIRVGGTSNRSGPLYEEYP